MNLPVIFSKAMGLVRGLAGNGMLLAKKRAPELLVGTGIALFGVTVFETVKATNQTNDILEVKQDKIGEYSNMLAEAEEYGTVAYTQEDYNKDLKSLNAFTRWGLIRTWAPVVTTGISSVIFVVSGYRILNGRYAATAIAYKTLEEGFNRYRGNVVDEFGKEVDWRMAHSMSKEEMEEEQRRQQEHREERLKRKKLLPRTQYSRNINNQIFDCNSCDNWKKFWLPFQVIDQIRLAESQLQDKVDMDGFALLNDAYDILHMPRTSQGAVVGWIKTPENKHNTKGQYVSLGFANDETPEEEIRRILASPSNAETYIWLTPNCDGVIYNKIDIPFSSR